MNILGIIVGILLGALVTGLIIWIVGKLGLGLEVSGFGPAYIAAIVIAVVSGVILWLLGLLGITISSWAPSSTWSSLRLCSSSAGASSPA
jgi:hypothetical protein